VFKALLIPVALKSFFGVFGQVWDQLKPPQTLSWQTLILLSLFSWFLCLLVATPELQELLAWLGWLFLTGGVGWATGNTRVNLLGWMFYPGPWITGALTCVLLYGWWNQASIATALISWPLISVAIAIIPRFFPNLTFSLPDPATRQASILLALVGLLLSCWFRFHFLVQDWVITYPSLLADNFSRSAFVVRLNRETSAPPRGRLLLNVADPLLQGTLNGRRWSETEAWLYNLPDSLQTLQNQTLERVPEVPEDEFWEFRGTVPYQVRETEYVLNLSAVWSGPSSLPGGYAIEKLCVIRQVPTSLTTLDGTNATAEPLTQVECQPTSDMIWGNSVAQEQN
jgi:hypothetical protein